MADDIIGERNTLLPVWASDGGDDEEAKGKEEEAEEEEREDEEKEEEEKGGATAADDEGGQSGDGGTPATVSLMTSARYCAMREASLAVLLLALLSESAKYAANALPGATAFASAVSEPTTTSIDGLHRSAAGVAVASAADEGACESTSTRSGRDVVVKLSRRRRERVTTLSGAS